MDGNSPALSCLDDEYSSLRNDDAATDDDEEDEDPKLVGMDGNSPALSMVLTRTIFSAIDGTNDDDDDDDDDDEHEDEEEEEEEDPIDVVTASVSVTAPLIIMSSDCKITSIEKKSFISSKSHSNTSCGFSKLGSLRFPVEYG
jgi:hypothetical protein